MKQLEASYHQERLWFIEHFEKNSVYPHSPTYHNGLLLLELSGEVDVARLDAAMQGVIARHEVLRTCLITRQQQPWQQVAEHVDFRLAHEWVAPAEPAAARARALAAARQPLALDGPLLVRSALYQHGPQAFTWALEAHHAIADYATLQQWAAEVLVAYTGYAPDARPAGEEAVTYGDFADWQKHLPEETLESLLFYWRKQLNGGRVAALQQPTDFPRELIHVYEHGELAFEVPGNLLAALGRWAEQRGQSLSEVVLAGFLILLARYAGQEEIVVGLLTDSRAKLDLTGVMGPVSNLVVLRSQLPASLSVAELLASVTKGVADSQRYQDMPFDKLVLELAPAKDMSRTALFDVLFQYHPATSFAAPDGLRITEHLVNHGWGKYDLNLLLVEDAAALRGVLAFNRQLYTEATVQQWLRHYLVVLEALSQADAATTIGTLPLLPAADVHLLLHEWNQTAAHYPADTCVHERLAQQAQQFAQRPAVVHGRQVLTYQELDARANRLAGVLRTEYHLQPNERVAVLLDRSEAIPVALLAVLKAGGAYVPVDPSYPQERIDYILTDAACRAIISSAGVMAQLPPQHQDAYLDVARMLDERTPAAALPSVNSPADTAYIIYTSGTTGRPKGCLVSHRNVMRLLLNDQLPFAFSEQDTWIMAHSFCFDFSVWEMYGALLYGGKLIVPTRDEVRDTALFLGLLKTHRVSVLNQTPGAFYQLIAEERSHAPKNLQQHLRYVCFGGDKLSPEHLREWTQWYPLTQVALVNMYGITETTVHVTFHYLTEADLAAQRASSPIGRPLPETTVYVLDEQLQLVPPGVKGELFVGGSGVGKGYWNRPQLTAERFLANPYKATELLYRSGDLARLLPNGQLEYLGRKDAQVKIRGYRIELAEIESNLLVLPALEQAVVTVGEDEQQSKYLVAYFTAAVPVQVGEVRAHLQSLLPDYMIPTFFVPLERFPLTANGKIDKQNLPSPYQVAAHEVAELREATSETEKALLVIWQQLLGRERLGINENFFQVGGHSLKAMQLLGAVQQQLDCKLELQHVFLHPTIVDLAVLVDSKAKTRLQAIEPVAPQPYYELSHAQLRLWVISQVEEGSRAYNVPTAVWLDGPLDTAAFDRALQALADRHEALRTVFKEVQGQPRQYIVAAEQFELRAEVVDLQHTPEAEKQVGDYQTQEQAQVFDLVQGPLIRVKLLRLSPERHLLLCTLHHIISDGLTMAILLKDVLVLYRAFSRQQPNPLVPLRIQYKDYVAWQQRLSGEGTAQAQRDYWHAKLSEAPPLALATDFPRPEVRHYRGGRETIRLAGATARAITTLSQQHGLTTFMSVLALLKLLLYKYTGQTDTTVGSVVAGRNHPELAEQVGFFVNTLALRTELSPADSFVQFLLQVKQQLLADYHHQDYPFDKLVDELAPANEPGRHPLFDVMLNEPPHDVDPGDQSGDGLRMSALAVPPQTAKFDLLFSLHQREQDLEITLEYDKELFRPETSQRLLQHLRQLAVAAVAHPEQPMRSLSLLSEPERAALATWGSPAALPQLGVSLQAALLASLQQHPEASLNIGAATYTYAQLSRQASAVAAAMQPYLAAGDVAVIHTRHEWLAIVALVAAVQLAATSVVLGDGYGPLALKAILAHCKPTLVLTDEPAELAASAVTVLNLPALAEAEPGPLVLKAAPVLGSLARLYPTSYQGYTSPVELEEVPYHAYCRWLLREAGLSPDSVVGGHLASAAHSLFKYVLPALLAGSRVHLLGSDPVLAAPGSLTHAFLTEAQLRALARQLSQQPGLGILEVLLAAHLPTHAANLQLLAPLLPAGPGSYRGILCVSGNPEVLAGTFAWLTNAVVPGYLGRPLPGSQLAILDAAGQLVPLGVPGDLRWLAPGQLAAWRGRWQADGTVQLASLPASAILLGDEYLHVAELEQLLAHGIAGSRCRILASDLLFHAEPISLVATAEKLSAEDLLHQLALVCPAVGHQSLTVLALPALPNQPTTKTLRKLGIVGQTSRLRLEQALGTTGSVEEYRLKVELVPLAVQHLAIEEGNYVPADEAGAAALLAADTVTLPQSTTMAYATGGPLAPASDAPKTLTAALLRTAAAFPDKGLTLVQAVDQAPSFISYAQLLQEARQVLGGLQHEGLAPGQAVVLQIADSRQYLAAFWGCVLGGITPVTVAVPATYRAASGVLSKLANTWRLLHQPAIVCSPELSGELHHWGAMQELPLTIFSVPDLLAAPPSQALYQPEPQEPVFLQLTSGSTGTPKCIPETHAGIICHIHSSALACAYTAANRTLNWLPFDHVVPILTYHLKDVYLGSDQVIVKTELILTQPTRWLDYLAHYRITHTWSPNFGYKLVADALATQLPGTWDLSAVVYFLNAGEQVTLPVLARFLELTAPYGVTERAMMPSFGMAEVCTCMTYQTDFTLVSGVHYVQKHSLGGRLHRLAAPDASTVAFVDLGPPSPGVEIRITDAANQVVPEGVIGRFQIRSGSVTPGYLHNPAANAEAFVGDNWFNSGDLGFLLNGRLSLTGREKETIIIRGANFYCYEFEDEVSLVEGVRPTFVASCEVQLAEEGTEGLAIFFSPIAPDLAANIPVIKTIRTVITAKFGVAPHFVLPVPQEVFPKTTSGKIQRKHLKELLEAGHYRSLAQEIEQHLHLGDTLADSFFEKHWTPAALAAEPARPPATVLALVEAQCSWPSALSQAGHQLISVTPGSRYARHSATHYTIDPALAADYEALLGELAAEARWPDIILHAWYFDQESSAAATTLWGGVDSLRGLAKALAQHLPHPTSLWLLTSQLQAVHAADQLAPAKAPMTGLLKSIALEQPLLWCRHLDVPADETSAVAGYLLQEMMAPAGWPEVAYRQQQRYSCELQKLTAGPSPAGALPLRPGGLYLLTGGLGGIGTILANYLLQQLRVRLLLVGRSNVHEAATAAAEAKQRAYQRLRASGAVTYRALDVQDTAALAAFVAEMEATYAAPLDGILHLAGTLDEPHHHWQQVEQHLVASEPRETYAQLFEAKVAGTLSLNELLKQRPNALFVAFSSVNSFFGAYSYGAYAAANSFLDYFVQYQRRVQGTPAYCLNWSNWDNIGMNHNNQLAAVIRAKGFLALSETQGIHSFLRGLSLSKPQVFIGLDHGNWNVLRYLEPEVYVRQVTSLLYRSAQPELAAQQLAAILASLPRNSGDFHLQHLDATYLDEQGNIDEQRLSDLLIPDAGSNFVAPQTDTEKILAELWREVLHVQHISLHDNFFEIGGNSLKLLRLFAKLQDQFPGQLQISNLFDYPDIYRLAKQLEQAASQQAETFPRKAHKVRF